MTQEEIDGLKQGDAIYHLSCDANDGHRVFIRDYSTLYVRSLGRGGLEVSHSQSMMAAQWATDGKQFLDDIYCLKENIEKAALLIAIKCLANRLSRAEQIIKDTEAEIDEIRGTIPKDLIDFESLKNAK